MTHDLRVHRMHVLGHQWNSPTLSLVSLVVENLSDFHLTQIVGIDSNLTNE
jgi:hypothetical protein